MRIGGASAHIGSSKLPRLVGTSIRPTLLDTRYSARGRRRSAVPKRFSANPRPYIGAVSNSRIPRSQASSTSAWQWDSSSRRNRLPNGAEPNPSDVTDSSVEPIRLRSMGDMRESGFDDEAGVDGQGGCGDVATGLADEIQDRTADIDGLHPRHGEYVGAGEGVFDG